MKRKPDSDTIRMVSKTGPTKLEILSDRKITPYQMEALHFYRFTSITKRVTVVLVSKTAL